MVVPTRNSHPDIIAHLGSLEALVSQGAEVVFADSESTDGTLEALAGFQNQHGGTILNLPPGLYAAWNAGVAHSHREWLTFSTLGDKQSSQGLRHLLEVAQNLRADVVASPPRMKSGFSELPDRWPIHTLAATLSTARLLDRLECLHWLCGFLPGTMLGSAASNIYRREFLADHPFPTEFGHEGDVAWGIDVSTTARVGITPTPCADFQVHERAVRLNALQQKQRFEQLVDLARRRLADFPQIASELELSWRRQADLWDWICRLEGIAETAREQKSYIVQLEQERRSLKDQVVQLENLPLFSKLPFVKRGLFSPLLRRLNSTSRPTP